MKMRKLFAGVAALATLFGGLALGAGAANAAVPTVEVDPTTSVVTSEAPFTFNATNADYWQGRDLRYLKLADYVQYQSATSQQPQAAYGVQTVEAQKPSLQSALRKLHLLPSQPDPGYDADPMAYVMGLPDGKGFDQSAAAPWSEGNTRQFADLLRDNHNWGTNIQYLPKVEFDASQVGASRTVELPAGVYLFVDVAAGVTSSSDPASLVAQSAPIILSSGVLNDEKDKLVDPIGTKNEVDLKNHVTTVTKSVQGASNGTVSTGQTVTYVLTTTSPITTGFLTAYSSGSQVARQYPFTLVDEPKAGQTVDLTKLVVKVDGIDQPLALGADYVITVGDKTIATAEDAEAYAALAGGETTEFVVDLTKFVNASDYLTATPVRYGKTVTVTYDATITASDNDGSTDAKDHNTALKDIAPVKNDVTVNDNGTTAAASTTLTLGGFKFRKTDAQGKALAGAEFTIKAKQAGAVTPTYAKAVSQDPSGQVFFNGLADGVYTVTETEVPGGYLQSVAASFEVTIQSGEPVSFIGTDAWGLAPTNRDPGSLGQYENYDVKNVRNVAELPKTGAAGIAMFTVIGLLLAGAAATVYVKSRKASAALRA